MEEEVTEITEMNWELRFPRSLLLEEFSLRAWRDDVTYQISGFEFILT